MIKKKTQKKKLPYRKELLPLRETKSFFFFFNFIKKIKQRKRGIYLC